MTAKQQIDQIPPSPFAKGGRRGISRVCAAALAAALLLLPGTAGALMSLRRGDAPPAFALSDLAGRRVALADLAGSPVAVVFFSTWSPRSAEVLDDFRRYAEELGPKGLKVVAVNVDGENLDAARAAAVREYAAARALPFPVLLDARLEVFSAWGVMAHPTEVLLDAGGRIAYVLPGYPLSLREELRDELARVLGIAAPPPAAVSHPARGLAPGQYHLGRRFLAKGDLERAREAFLRAAAEDPGSPEAPLMASRVALALGDPGPAEALLRELAPEVVNRGDLRSLAGALTLQKGDLAAAERLFRALRERLPGEGWGEWGLGLVALARDDRAAALPLLASGRALLPEHPEGEAFVRRWFRDRCLRRESAPEDDALVALFPALAAIRERYCNLYR